MTNIGVHQCPPLAALDLGSNSFRLEVARVVDGHYQRLDSFKSTVRLGAGLDAASCLTGEPVARALACLRELAPRLSHFSPQHVRAVATQAVRQASNRAAFVAQASAALGFPVDVISGLDEAHLIHAGVVQLQPSDEPRLVVDVGGRSTELILGQGDRVLHAVSVPVGAVDLSLRFFADGRLTADALQAAQLAAGQALAPYLAPFEAATWRQTLGSSGTASAVAQVLAATGRQDDRITTEDLEWLMGRCLEAGHVDALTWRGLKPERRAVLPGGLAILYTLAVHLRWTDLRATPGALRHGVIIELARQLAVA